MKADNTLSVKVTDASGRAVTDAKKEVKMMRWGDYGWGMGFGWVWMILFWALVIVGAAYLVKLITGRARREGRHDTALDILKKRYAKGEITKEEFEKMKDDLMKS